MTEVTMKDKIEKVRHKIDYESALNFYLQFPHFKDAWEQYYARMTYCPNNRKRRVKSKRRLICYFFKKVGISLKNTNFDLTFVYQCRKAGL